MWNTATERVEVLIWLAEPLLRAGVWATLGGTDRIHLLDGGNAHSGRADVVVTDWASGVRIAGRDAGPEVPGLSPQSRVLIICAQGREYEIRPALATGVRGIVGAYCTSNELVAAVSAIARGGTYICPILAQRSQAMGRRGELTAREMDVLQLLARGQCNKLIAKHLDIAVGTVKTHVKGIMSKLGAESRTEAASLAIHSGMARCRGDGLADILRLTTHH